MPDLRQHAEDLDALTAAPQNHRLLFENETVRVLDTFVRPGQTVPLHASKTKKLTSEKLTTGAQSARQNGDGCE